MAALACALKPDPKIFISSFLSNRRTSERFEFARDGHWSSIGQGVAVEAVMTSRFNCQGSLERGIALAGSERRLEAAIA